MPTLDEPGAYLRRIGLSTPVDLQTVHRAHATTIPFENFEPAGGRPVPLDPGGLEEKLVTKQRGGYCFEQNLVLMAAIESLGLGEPVPLLARVRVQSKAERPLDHLLLSVTDDAGTWLADVGFGGAGLLDPVPFVLDAEVDQSGWRYRLVRDGDEVVLQAHQDGGWADLYGFEPRPVPLIDIEVSNWYTATHPGSTFVTGHFVGARRVDRCLTLVDYGEPVLIERLVGQASSAAPVPREEAPQILADRFGLQGVRLDEDGRLELT